MLSLVLTMCQLFPVSLLTKAVLEKNEQTDDAYHGFKRSGHILSWWLSAVIQFSFISLLCTVVIKLFVIHTPLWIVLLYVSLFCLGSISFAFLLSVFFTNAVLSAVIGPIAFFGALLPRYLFFSTNRYERVTSKLFASLLLPTAFSFGADILADFELSEIGLSPENWLRDDYSFVTSMVMMAFDTVYAASTARKHKSLLSPPSPHPSHTHRSSTRYLAST